MELQRAINEWMKSNLPLMVQCPHQPGNLRITKQGCHARRQKATHQNLENLSESNLGDYMYKMGLLICLHCTEE